MNEKQLNSLQEYILQRVDVQKVLLEKSKDEMYHMGAIMELLALQERMKLILDEQHYNP